MTRLNVAWLSIFDVAIESHRVERIALSVYRAFPAEFALQRFRSNLENQERIRKEEQF